MRTLAAFLGLTALAIPLPAAAEFLLNCRLIDSGNPIYRQHCKAETRYLVVNECSVSNICVVKKQNFKGVFSGSAGLSANGIPIATSNPVNSTVALSGNLDIAASSNITGTAGDIGSAPGLSVNTSTTPLAGRSVTGSAGVGLSNPSGSLTRGVTRTAGGVVSGAGGLLK
jgi:hypothetical protein